MPSFNLVNEDGVKEHLAALVPNLNDQRRKWFVKNLLKLIRSQRPLLQPFTVVMATARAWPDWVYSRLEEGAELFLFPDQDNANPARQAFDRRAAAVAGFLETLTELAGGEEPTSGAGGRYTALRRRDRDAAGRILDDLGKKSLEAVEQLSAAWDERLARRRAEEEAESGPRNSVKVLDIPGDGDLALYRLATFAGLREESDLMGHCVGRGGYDEEFRQGISQFLSLRDGANRPHVTLQIHRRTLSQFRGRSNQTPVPRYHDALRFVFNRLDLPPAIEAQPLLAAIEFVFHARGQPGRRYGRLTEVLPLVAERRGYRVYREEGDGTTVFHFFLDGATPLRFEVGRELHISGSGFGPAAFELLKEVATAAADSGRLPPPSVSAASLLSSYGLYYGDGRYGYQIDFATVVQAFTNGDTMRSLQNERSKQNTLFYVDGHGQVLGTFTLRHREEVDRNRLYVIDLDTDFASAPDRIRNLTAFLNTTEVFLSDAVTAQRMGIIFCRSEWRYMPFSHFFEQINQILMAEDMRWRIETCDAEGMRTSLHRFLTRAATIEVVPQSDKSPFHIIRRVERGAAGGPLAPVVSALNHLMFPTPFDHIGESAICFDRQLYAWTVKRRTRPARALQPAPEPTGGLIKRLGRLLGRRAPP